MDKFLKPNYALVFFLTSIFLIEFQFPFEGINIGNLIIVVSSLILCSVTYISGASIRRPEFSFFRGYSLSTLLLIMLCIFSALWSMSPLGSFVQGVYSMAILFGCIAASRYNFYEVCSLTIKIAFVLSILSLLSPIISTQYAFQPFSTTGIPELRGVFKHQQRLSLNMAAVLGLYMILSKNGLLASVMKGKWFSHKAIVVFVIFLAFLAAQARLYSIFFLVALLFTFFYRKYPKISFLIIFLTFTTVIFNFEQIDFFLRYYDYEETLSGRTTVWTRTYLTALDAPFLGYGFTTFDTEYFDYLWFDYRPPHAHNSFLQAFFDLGILGLFLLVFVIFSHLSLGHRFSVVTEMHSVSIFLVILSVLSGLTGVVYLGKPSVLMCLTFVFLACESRLLLRVKN